jgi:hypothetical protein
LNRCGGGGGTNENDTVRKIHLWGHSKGSNRVSKMKEYLNYASDSSYSHAAHESDSDEESSTDLSELFFFGPNKDCVTNDEPDGTQSNEPDLDCTILDG